MADPIFAQQHLMEQKLRSQSRTMKDPTAEGLTYKNRAERVFGAAATQYGMSDDPWSQVDAQGMAYGPAQFRGGLMDNPLERADFNDGWLSFRHREDAPVPVDMVGNIRMPRLAHMPQFGLDRTNRLMHTDPRSAVRSFLG